MEQSKFDLKLKALDYAIELRSKLNIISIDSLIETSQKIYNYFEGNYLPTLVKELEDVERDLPF